tara:strand:+ start:86 stop:544 length:459 start_codon:yes stop_codon:yes gene_type:complete
MNIKWNKWWTIAGLSVLPSVIGYLINFLVLQLPVGGFAMFTISFMFFTYWLYSGYKFKKTYDMDVLSLGLIHIIGLLSLVLVGYQIIFVGAFSSNLIGLISQLYFVPGLNLIARFDYLNILNDVLKLCTATLVLMIITFYMGGRLYMKRLKR